MREFHYFLDTLFNDLEIFKFSGIKFLRKFRN